MTTGWQAALGAACTARDLAPFLWPNSLPCQTFPIKHVKVLHSIPWAGGHAGRVLAPQARALLSSGVDRAHRDHFANYVIV